MSHITVAFAGPANWIGRLICWVTAFRYSHVALVSPCGQWYVEASGRGKPGVRVRDMAKRQWDDMRRIPHPKPEAVWEAAISQAGKDYDFAYLWGYLFRRSWQDPQKWACQELIVWAAAEAGHPIIHSEYERATPQHLHMISEAL